MSTTILPFAPNDPAFQRINPASLSAEWCTNGVEAPAPWGAPEKVRDVYAGAPHDKQIECRWLDYTWGKPLKVIRGAVNGAPAGWFIEEPGWLQQDKGLLHFLQRCIDPSVATEFQLPRFHIYPHLQQGGTHLIVAPPKAAKTFVALEIVWCQAISGERFLGRYDADVRGPWLFIAGEGADTTRGRLEGMQRRRKKRLPVGSVILYPSPVNFRVSSEVVTLIEVLRCYRCVGLIVDTASRCGAGAEGPEDMPEFVAGVTRAGRDADCTVVILHHSPLADAKRARGHTALPAAIDSQWLLVKGKADGRTAFRLQSSLSRTSGNEGEIIAAFQVESERLGINADGREICVGVVEPCDDKAFRDGAVALSDNEKLCKQALEAAAPGGIDWCADIAELGGVTEDNWRVRYYELRKVAEPDIKPDTLRKAFNRARDSLREKGVIEQTPSGKWALA